MGIAYAFHAGTQENQAASNDGDARCHGCDPVYGLDGLPMGRCGRMTFHRARRCNAISKIGEGNKHETSSVKRISPKRDLPGLIGITRRYAESQLTKCRAPPGWGLDWDVSERNNTGLFNAPADIKRQCVGLIKVTLYYYILSTYYRITGGGSVCHFLISRYLIPYHSTNKLLFLLIFIKCPFKVDHSISIYVWG